MFRTYGSDTKNVVFEMDKFARGEHPCFNGRNGMPLVKFDGSKNSKDFRIREPDVQVAHFYRLSENLKDLILVQGASHERVDYSKVNQIMNEDDVTMLRDHFEIYVGIIELLKKHSVMAIQDDFEAMIKTDWQESSLGKPLLVDQADYNTQHIFFDDHERFVDVRDVVTGERIPRETALNMYLVQVQSHRAVLESDYFIKAIELCEANRDEEIRRTEASIQNKTNAVLETVQVPESDWERLQKCPDEEYLMRTVLPVLYQGMRIVDIERPVAPLEYLAVYLLKNQNKVQLPPKILTTQQPKEESA